MADALRDRCSGRVAQAARVAFGAPTVPPRLRVLIALLGVPNGSVAFTVALVLGGRHAGALLVQWRRASPIGRLGNDEREARSS